MVGLPESISGGGDGLGMKGPHEGEEEDFSIFRPRPRPQIPIAAPALSLAGAGAGAGGGLAPVHSDRIRSVEEAADLVVTLLIDAGEEGEGGIEPGMAGPHGQQHSTLQTLVLEETAKLLGAVSRQQWATLRQRSGRNAAGTRSNLGALVDPLGIFSQGRLVNPDSNDERVLESASAIVQAVRASSPPPSAATGDVSSGGGGPLTALTSELQALSPAEAAQISSIIADKVWTRRRELVRIGGRFTRVLLQQARQRL